MSNNDNIAPSVPEFRRMAIGSAPAIPMMRPVATQQSKASQVVTSTSKASWEVRQVPALDDFYPLERTHAYINDADCQVVADRIVKAMKENSIAVTFDKASATATTSDQTEIGIQLFMDNGDVVVECQRLIGCCFTFRQNSNLVLKAAKGETASIRMTPPVPAIPAMPPPMPMAPSVPPMPSQHHQDADEEALEIALDLLKATRLDAQILGMESLAQLSASKKCCLNDASTDVVIANIQDEFLQHHALHVVANLLSNRQISPSRLSDDTVQTLVNELQNGCPQTAHQVARCLVALPSDRVGLSGIDKSGLLEESKTLLQSGF